MNRIHLRRIDTTGSLQLTASVRENPSACVITQALDPASLPSLDELARQGAKELIARALQAEVASYLEAFADARDEQGRALVVRNGHARPRQITVGSGTIEIEAPRVNDKRVVEGVRQKFSSQILPPYMRRSASVAEVLPILYLRGLSTGDFRPALSQLLGEKASGLSASTITRMLADWDQEYADFCQAPIVEDVAYIWVDGVHTRVRLEDDAICLLVVIGVTKQGNKRLLAVHDGYRESTESWADVLRSLVKRGMRAPALAVGDGALGFWAALRDVWPHTKVQRCIFHKTTNILDKMPKKEHEKAKEMLKSIFFAASKADAKKACKEFAKAFSKYEKAVACLTDDVDAVLTFMDFPKAHWKSLRTTNVIESSFATVRLRTCKTKGPGSRRRGITMAYKLLAMAETRWRKFYGAEHFEKSTVKSNVGDTLAA